MMARRSVAVALTALLASAAPVTTPARAETAAVVAACGTLPAVLPVGGKAILTVDTSGRLCQNQNGGSQFPAAAAPITGNATGTTGAVVGTLAGVSAKTTYICGFNVSAVGGTAAVGPIVVAGTVTGSMTFELNSSVAGTNISENFYPCIPASAANTAITTTTTADGTASAVAVNSWGFQL